VERLLWYSSKRVRFNVFIHEQVAFVVYHFIRFLLLLVRFIMSTSARLFTVQRFEDNKGTQEIITGSPDIFLQRG
jgi:hypothetical protein